MVSSNSHAQSSQSDIAHLNNQAAEQAKLGNYQTAIDLLEQALNTDPAVSTAYNNLSALYSYLASEAYRKALNSKKQTTPPILEGIETTQ